MVKMCQEEEKDQNIPVNGISATFPDIPKFCSPSYK